VNYRPEYRHEWGTKTYYTQLHLAPFGSAETEEFLDALLGAPATGVPHAASLQALKQLILEKTQGTPFFMEEVVQTLAEEGVLSGGRGHYRLERAPTELHISPTVQGVLAARIDRLAAEEKTLLQQLAVIGREFPLGLVRQVVSQPEEALYRLLSALQHKEFLYEQPAFPEVEYIFKHALTQEVAYNSVLLERRKVLHERTAQAIEHLYRRALDEHYSDLAHHYSRSDNTQKAVDYLQLAGQEAVQRSANVEAISHLTTALELLKTLRDTPERAQQELTLRVTLGPALMATKGFAAPEVKIAYVRARALCQQVGETPQLFPVLCGLCMAYLNQGELHTAHELGEQTLRVAQRAHDSALLSEAHNLLGSALDLLGEFAAAREHLEQSLALYDPQQYHSSLAFLYGFDPRVFCLSRAVTSLWALGYPDQALQRSQEALTLAQALSHPHSLAFARGFAAELHQRRRDRQAAQEQAEALITLSIEQGLSFWLARGIIIQGWVLSEQGQGEEGIAQIRRGLSAYRTTGAELWRSYHLALLAEAYGGVGQTGEGLIALAEAREFVHKTGERHYEAELYRLKGELMLQQFNVQEAQFKDAEGEAESCFLNAIEIARKQEAKSLELRATMSLARLWQQQGKQQEAHSMLSEIYNWFTEGFDTKDLQEAKALLQELEAC
jgi:predicted ATPase